MKHTLIPLMSVALIALATVLSGCAHEAARHPWGRWTHLPQETDFFPIGVWGQNPASAGRYKALGVDYYISLHRGPTPDQMADMRRHNMPVICSFNDYARESLLDEPLVWAWMHGDEPDLAHVYPRAKLMGPDGMEILAEHWPDVHAKLVAEGTTYEGWGMGHNPVDLQERYARIKQLDPTRPVLIQLSRAVAFDGKYNGRGDHSGNTELYPGYIAASDLVSFDVYPVANGLDDELWRVPHGLDNLRAWGAAETGKPIMVILEAGYGDKTQANHDQRRAQAWMALNHGASSITWFCHRWATVDGQRKLVSTAMPLTDPEVGQSVKAINDEIHGLAAVINSPVIPDAATVETADPDVPVEMALKTHDGAIYLFAVAMKPGTTTATFTVPEAAEGAPVEVINEGRTLTVQDGSFTDAFAFDFDVNLYRIK